MNYIGSHESINWLQILFFLSISQWIFTAYYLYKYKKNLLLSIPKYKKYKNPIPFIKDTFYIYWNLYPIVFYILFSSIDSSFNITLANLNMITSNNAIQEAYKILFQEKYIQYFDLIVIVTSIIIAYWGTFITQPKKQKRYISQKDKIYWWDIRLSKEIYWIRLIFLFFNLILISFLVYLLTKIAIFIMLILGNTHSIHINPFYPDNYGGLGSIINLASVIMLIYLFRGIMGIKGLIDHRKLNDKAQFLGDIYHASYLLFAIIFLFFVTHKLNILLNTVNIEYFLNNNYYIELTNSLNSTISNFENLTNKINSFSNYYKQILDFNNTPVILKIFSGTLFTLFSSFIIWFFNNEIAKFFKQKEI
jgi:hypothetical protein